MAKTLEANLAIPAADSDTVADTSSQYFKPSEIPPCFRQISDDVRLRIAADGTPLVRWGWKQWIAMAPKLQKHITAHGRSGLRDAVFAAQKALPKDLHRPKTSLSVASAPSATPDIIKLVAFIATALPQAPTIKAPRKKAHLKVVPKPARASTRATLAETPPANAAQMAPDAPMAAPAPIPAPTPAATSSDVHMAALMAMPVSTFMPVLKAFVLQAVREALAPHHDVIAQTVRAAVIDVVGAPVPTPPPTPTPPAAEVQDLTPQTSPVADLAPEVGHVVITHPAEDHVASTADIFPAHAEAEAAHDLESQMAAVAKALQIPTAIRQSVLVVGLHPKVEQEVEQFYGKSFRFTFKRPDAVRGVNDVPASTEAILLCRKNTTRELLALSRRDNLPLVNIQNNSAAVLGALREVFPESTDGLYIR